MQQLFEFPTISKFKKEYIPRKLLAEIRYLVWTLGSDISKHMVLNWNYIHLLLRKKCMVIWDTLYQGMTLKNVWIRLIWHQIILLSQVWWWSIFFSRCCFAIDFIFKKIAYVGHTIIKHLWLFWYIIYMWQAWYLERILGT